MNYKVSRAILEIGLAIGVVITLFGACLVRSNPIAVIGIVIMVISILQTIFFFRCPHCKTGLNIRGGKPKYCPECGGKIEW